MLAKQAQGKKYINSYYSSAPAIANILNEHPELKAQAAQLMIKLLPAFSSLVASRRAVVDETVVEKAVRLLDAVAAYGDPDCAKKPVGVKTGYREPGYFQKFWNTAGKKVNGHPHSGWLDFALKDVRKSCRVCVETIACGDKFLKTIQHQACFQ